MAKAKTLYICAQCGYESGKWLGKCPQCDSWNSFSEELQSATASPSAPKRTSAASLRAKKLDEITGESAQRWATGSEELDRVLGGGLVWGSVVLLGGDPGIGKSTLLLQVAQELSKNSPVLYVSGEESLMQIKMRAERLSISSDDLLLFCETDMEAIEGQIFASGAGVVIIDSIQTMYRGELSSAAGSVTQVRESTASLARIAKQHGCAVVIVGHVTKQGAIAGPKVLEHLVDAVLYFEGDRQDDIRVLRTVKNRFGSTNEIGVFEMGETGMKEVKNPSELFVSEREIPVSGCAVTCTLEGTRPVLAEIQALCSYTAFGTPRRMSAGIDHNRMALLCAVLEKKVGLRLNEQDIYLNVVGGLRIDERSADLAVMAAIASSFQNRAIKAHVAAFGEVGLTGEVRAVNQVQKRVQECERLGYQSVVLPKKSLSFLKGQSIKLIAVQSVGEALNALMEKA